MSSIKPGSRPVSPLPRKRSKVQSALYSTLKHMSICCGAAVHAEVQMPLSLILFFRRPDANRQDHTCFFLKGSAQGSLNFTNKLKFSSLSGKMDRQNQDLGSSKPVQVHNRYRHYTKLLLLSLFILLQHRDFASHFLILHS